MKKIVTLFVAAGITLGVTNTAQAQFWGPMYGGWGYGGYGYGAGYAGAAIAGAIVGGAIAAGVANSCAYGYGYAPRYYAPRGYYRPGVPYYYGW